MRGTQQPGGDAPPRPDADVTQISIGRFRVGVTGLVAAIEELQSWRGRADVEIAQALFARLKPGNYIPASSQEEYQKAFLREYKKALGEKVEEEGSGLTIKILGPGCPSCDWLEQIVLTALVELGLPAAVEHLRDLQEIRALGVMGLPALMINGEVKTMGQAPTTALLKKWLEEARQQQK